MAGLSPVHSTLPAVHDLLCRAAQGEAEAAAPAAGAAPPAAGAAAAAAPGPPAAAAARRGADAGPGEAPGSGRFSDRGGGAAPAAAGTAAADDGWGGDEGLDEMMESLSSGGVAGRGGGRREGQGGFRPQGGSRAKVVLAQLQLKELCELVCRPSCGADRRRSAGSMKGLGHVCCSCPRPHLSVPTLAMPAHHPCTPCSESESRVHATQRWRRASG